jgi:hypothetical protein
MTDEQKSIKSLWIEPTRKVFYVDVGNLTREKALQYMEHVIMSHK